MLTPIKKVIANKLAEDNQYYTNKYDAQNRTNQVKMNTNYIDPEVMEFDDEGRMYEMHDGKKVYMAWTNVDDLKKYTNIGKMEKTNLNKIYDSNAAQKAAQMYGVKEESANNITNGSTPTGHSFGPNSSISNGGNTINNINNSMNNDNRVFNQQDAMKRQAEQEALFKTNTNNNDEIIFNNPKANSSNASTGHNFGPNSSASNGKNPVGNNQNNTNTNSNTGTNYHGYEKEKKQAEYTLGKNSTGASSAGASATNYHGYNKENNAFDTNDKNKKTDTFSTLESDTLTDKMNEKFGNNSQTESEIIFNEPKQEKWSDKYSLVSDENGRIYKKKEDGTMVCLTPKPGQNDNIVLDASDKVDIAKGVTINRLDDALHNKSYVSKEELNQVIDTQSYMIANDMYKNWKDNPNGVRELQSEIRQSMEQGVLYNTNYSLDNNAINTQDVKNAFTSWVLDYNDHNQDFENIYNKWNN